jgi:hypothetical protein
MQIQTENPVGRLAGRPVRHVIREPPAGTWRVMLDILKTQLLHAASNPENLYSGYLFEFALDILIQSAYESSMDRPTGYLSDQPAGQPASRSSSRPAEFSV